MAVDMGLPQLGQLSAEDEISLLQSGQVISAISIIFDRLNVMNKSVD